MSKLDDCVGVVHGHAVVGEQGVQEGTKHTPLWDPRVEGQCGGGDVAYPHRLGLARQEVQALSLSPLFLINLFFSLFLYLFPSLSLPLSLTCAVALSS